MLEILTPFVKNLDVKVTTNVLKQKLVSIENAKILALMKTVASMQNVKLDFIHQHVNVYQTTLEILMLNAAIQNV
jgi:hypothetical protein